MALKTAKICKEKGEKRVWYPVEPFDEADYSGFSVLWFNRVAEPKNRYPLFLATLVDMANLPA